MFGFKLPLRMMIVKLFSDAQPRNAEAVLEALAPIYGNERQFTKENIETHLMSLKAVGILADFDAELSGFGDLSLQYVITDYGKDKLKAAL